MEFNIFDFKKHNIYKESTDGAQDDISANTDPSTSASSVNPSNKFAVAGKDMNQKKQAWLGYMNSGNTSVNDTQNKPKTSSRIL